MNICFNLYLNISIPMLSLFKFCLISFLQIVFEQTNIKFSLQIV